MAYISDGYDTDDEIITGPLTLNGIKKIFLPRSHRHTVRSNDEGIHLAPSALLEVNSNLQHNVSKLSFSPEALYSHWDLQPNDSFLEIEKMVSSELCVNTNDVETDRISKESNDSKQKSTQSKPPYIKVPQDNEQTKAEQIIENPDIASGYNPSDAPNFLAPNVINTVIVKTPPKHKTPLSQKTTPGNKIVVKKKVQTSLTKKAFQHVVSPVATYINSPVVSLVKDGKPKKPLVAHSCIPKPIKSALKNKLNNKENYKLPSTAYKAAKETKMINIPDPSKLPHNQRGKQLPNFITPKDHN